MYKILSRSTGTRVGLSLPENPGNPPVFKPVNRVCVRCGQKPGFDGLISGVSTGTAQKSMQKQKAVTMRQKISNN